MPRADLIHERVFAAAEKEMAWPPTSQMKNRSYASRSSYSIRNFADPHVVLGGALIGGVVVRFVVQRVACNGR